MLKKNDLIIVVIGSLLYTVLFHKNPLGINFLIFELFVVSCLLLFQHVKIKGAALIISLAGILITAFATVLVFSVWSYFVNFIVFLLFIGCLIFPEIKSFFHAFILFFYSIFFAPVLFIRNLSESRFKNKKIGIYFKKIRIFLIPLIIIFIFILIYRSSNPLFDNMLTSIGDFLNDILIKIFGRLDLTFIITLIIGLFFCSVIFLRSPYIGAIENYKKKNDVFKRIKIRIKRKFPLLALKNEYKAGIFLFLILNLILLTVNIIDINWVWFNFEWNGSYLKQFVYTGTYLLILSIIISVVLVLYYFRGNLNFYKNNRLLSYLSYIWLAQNAILAISVGIRNFWYIYYFSLAYGRIGVYMFLALTLYGLYSVYIKVRYQKSAFYLIRHNAFSLIIVLVLSSVFNWDCIIAKYNFSNYNRSFVHLNYLSSLAPKALPYLDKSLKELNNIDSIQKRKFDYEYSYMSPEEYYSKIERKKEKFKLKWESKGFLSWNLPEYRAYEELFGKKK